MQLALKPTPHGQPARECVALLLRIETGAELLDELARHDITGRLARYFRLPWGVLVVPAAGQSLQCSPRAVAFGRLAENVFVPVDALLNAELSPEEWPELFPPGQVFVWHPSEGLWALSDADELSYSGLFLPPPRRPSAWDRAVPGAGLNGRLLSLAPQQPLGQDDLWQQVRDEIGSEPPRLDSLPKTPDEPTFELPSKIIRGVKRALEKLMRGLGPNRPAPRQQGRAADPTKGGARSGASSSSNWASLSRWWQDVRRKWTVSLEDERQRELRRLMHMLQSDPDKGLRFAIPFSNEAGRGAANPGSRLVERNVNYGSASSGPADYWGMSPAQRIDLAARYRELANREIVLGRHRRAAYIFARLLGDNASAARILADGGHFREAAALYEEKLRQPLEAARVLERGGHWSEAIAIYERLSHHEKVGDLYAELQQPEAAGAAYRQAVGKFLQHHDRLGAARILDDRLGEPDRAIEALAEGWPFSAQAMQCVEQLFRLLARLGRHDAADERIRSIALDGATNTDLACHLLKFFPNLAQTYPRESTRLLAADHTRLLAAGHLPRLGEGDVQLAMEALRRLAPQDRLLRRDTQRYGQRQKPKETRKPALALRRSNLATLGSIQLPVGNWTTLVSLGGTFYAAGNTGGQLIVARGAWSGPTQIASRPSWTAPVRSNSPALLAVCEWLGTVVLQGQFCHPITETAALPTFGDLAKLRVGSHPGLGARFDYPYVWGMAYTDRGTFDIVRMSDEEGSEWIWASYDAATQALLRTWRLPDYEVADDRLPTALFRDDRLYLGLGSSLHVQNVDDSAFDFKLPGQIMRLAGSRIRSRKRIIVTLDEGGILIWGDAEDDPRSRFGIGLESPHCCLTLSGLLIVAAQGVIEIYDTREGRLAHVLTHEWPGLKPAAVAPLDRHAGFAVLCEDGTLRHFDVKS